jgi:cation diffusion facilitator family transporter
VSAFIGYQAIHRLTGPAAHEVDAAWYTLVVVGVVLAIDVSRATLSLRASRRLHSAALAANALHFASDFVGTLAVLVGLILVRAGYPSGDAIAGLVVAVAVVFAAGLLIRTNVRVLMDEAPAGVDETVREAIHQGAPSARITRLRVRHAAGRNFVEATLEVSADAAVGQGERVADNAERAIREALPDSDVTIRVATRSGDDLRERATGAVVGRQKAIRVQAARV